MNTGKNLKYLLTILPKVIAIFLFLWLEGCKTGSEINEYTGSQSCRPCHEKFYNLWDGSHHGLAMQPVTGDLLSKYLLVPGREIMIGDLSYRPVIIGDSLFIIEYGKDHDTIAYRAIHAMGGKYVYYFLTPLEGGKLQVLPLAYDLKSSQWYDNPGSGVRHFEGMSDDALDWKSYPFTFNTSCYGCHVSQLSTNYEPVTMTYNTQWREPGINCETCHGPAEDHIRAFARVDSAAVLPDIEIISTKRFTAMQHNSSCGSCHAKMVPITSSFTPGEYFYDNFDLVTVENPDFYPDGRDLGENYTYASWEMNACKNKSDLHCVSCHTSSGRYKFREKPNEACMPCHESRVRDPEPHTRHDPAGEGGHCISCHMPKTTFARMERSDHSFRPPAPAATIEFGSPNACNICHTDKTARWADMTVRKERGSYQDDILLTGRMMKEARANNWENAGIITEGIFTRKLNPLFAAAFIRLADAYNIGNMKEAIFSGASHPSPLVRAASAHAMTYPVSRQTVSRLVSLAADTVNLVRLNAGYALSMMPADLLLQNDTAIVFSAVRDYAASLVTRKDQWGSWYNLGNFYAGMGDPGSAAASYELAVRINPGATVALVNAGFMYSQMGMTDLSENAFLKALETDSMMEAANLNLALLYGEKGRTEVAARYFGKTLAINPENPVAAYNLAILLSDTNPEKALELSRICVKYGNGEEKYAALRDILENRTSEKPGK